MSDKQDNNSNTKEKLLFIGFSPDNQNDFGRFTCELLPLLKEEYDITLFAIENQTFTSGEVGYSMIEAQDSAGPFGFQKIVNVVNVLKPEHLIIFHHPQIIAHYLNAIVYSGKCDLSSTQVLGFAGLDYSNPLMAEIKVLEEGLDGLLVTTNFAKKELKDGGFTKPIHLVQGGKTSRDFMNLPQKEARKQLDLPLDTFIIYCGLENTTDNHLDILVESYIRFLAKYMDQLDEDDKPKIILLLGCGMIDRGWALESLMETIANEYKLENWDRYIKFAFRDRQNNHPNFTNAYLNYIYNSVNLGVSSSSGQFWGFSNFDMASLGIPQIVPRVAAQGEIYDDKVHLIDPVLSYRAPFVVDSSMGKRSVISIDNMTKALSQSYKEFIDNPIVWKQKGRSLKQYMEKYQWSESADRMIDAIKKIPVYRQKISEIDVGNKSRV